MHWFLFIHKTLFSSTFKKVTFIEDANIQLSSLKFVEYRKSFPPPCKMLILLPFRFCCPKGGRITSPQANPAPAPLVTSAHVIRRTIRHCLDKIPTTIFVETVIPKSSVSEIVVTIIRVSYLKFWTPYNYLVKLWMLACFWMPPPYMRTNYKLQRISVFTNILLPVCVFLLTFQFQHCLHFFFVA